VNIGEVKNAKRDIEHDGQKIIMLVLIHAKRENALVCGKYPIRCVKHSFPSPSGL
jgi:hypothetical protein